LLKTTEHQHNIFLSADWASDNMRTRQQQKRERESEIREKLSVF